MANYDPNVYGHVNGEPVYSRDEFIFKCRGFNSIETDEELMEFARKVSGNWYSSGHQLKFIDFYLSDYALSDPYRSLTHKEFARLKELQKLAREEHERAEEEREWKYVTTYYYADNSVIEIWEDKNGIRKEVMVTGSHGDACY